MKWISRKDTPVTLTRIVQLEGDEVNWSDDHLLLVADKGRVNVQWPLPRYRSSEGWMLPQHPGHFGGYVERRPGLKDPHLTYAKIVVHTD